MARLDKALVLEFLVLILRPAIRFCLRHSIKLQDLIECAKKAYVDAAEQHLKSSGHLANTSRISVMTGVHRRDINRIQEQGVDTSTDRDLVTRVMGHWMSDHRFTTKSGEPRVLSEGFEGCEFNELCHSISKDINPGTILFELQRVNAIQATKGGIRLIHQSYVPEGNPTAGFSILADDCDTLLDTVEENVLKAHEVPQFHARTSYDNVDPKREGEIKRWILKEGHQFHRRVREFVSKFDRDINPDNKFKGSGIKVTFSAFGNVETTKGQKRGSDDRE